MIQGVLRDIFEALEIYECVDKDGLRWCADGVACWLHGSTMGEGEHNLSGLFSRPGFFQAHPYGCLYKASLRGVKKFRGGSRRKSGGKICES